MATRLTTKTLINLLFEHVMKADGTSYSATEVAAGSGVSAPMISAMRSGMRDNPSLDIIQRLLDFFDVPMIYLDAKSETQAIQILENRGQFRLRNADDAISIREFELILKFIEEIKQDEIRRKGGSETN